MITKQTKKNINLRVLIHIFCVLGLWLGANACKQKGNTLEKEQNTVDKMADTTAQTPELYIDLENEFQKHPKTSETITIAYDAFFKTPKTFKGYALTPLIDSIVAANTFDTTGAIVVFECKDGYKPVMDLAQVMKGKMGYVVYKDASQKDAWADSIDAAFTPYYVAWTNVAPKDHTYMWPYGLVGIRLKSAAIEFAAIYPYHNAELVKGFQLFRDNCMKCHAVNKVGGSMGPELNTPKNITEYWTEENIINFVKSPTSFRNNAHMPAITGLTDTELNEIIGYLKGMKEHKVF